MKERENPGQKLVCPERIFVLSGPSGVGKNTLAAEIVNKGFAQRAVTATTRPPRPGEVDGEDYFFINEKKFLKWREDGLLLEWNRYGGHLYGTPVFSVNQTAGSAEAVLLVIDVNGGLNLKRTCEKVTLVFIMPPSMAELEKRLRNRGDVDEDGIKKRLRVAGEELKMKDNYDYLVINDKLDKAAEEIERVIKLA